MAARRKPDRWDPEARKSLLRFGRWIFLSTALSFVAMQIDRLTLGRLIDPAALGILFHRRHDRFRAS